jgi:DNA-binding winged helix-turn-helix (wHTH) protein/tetratricopeptide (TPR) repeat protein
VDTAKPIRFRFSPFEADLAAEQLYENGEPVPLQSKPFQFLATLLNHHGSLVTREQMSHVLWPDIYVQVNQGLNAAARKVRIALKDDFNDPKYFATLGSRGYCFIHAAEILAWSTSSQEKSEKLVRIAVLPFESEVDSGAWGSGFSGELVSLLGRTHSRIKVIAPTSSQTYAGSSFPPAKIAEELGVCYVVTGAVSHERENVSACARFFDIEENRVLWEGATERTNIGDVLTEITRNITKALQPEMLPASTNWGVRNGKLRIRTATEYFAAQGLWFQRSPSTLQQTLTAYQNVAQKDPGFAQAHAGVATAWIVLAAHDLVAPRPAYQAAMAASERALKISENLPEALVAQAWAKLALDHDWAAATRIFEHALHLNSSYAFAYAGYGHLLLARGRVDEGVSAIEEGCRLDPLSSSMRAHLSTACYYARRYDEAIRMARKTREVDEGNCAAMATLGACYLAQRRFQEAVEQFETAVQRADCELYTMEAHLAHAYAQVGKTASAEPILQRLENRNGQAPKPAYQIALIRLVLGDVNGAVRWLERACQERFQRTLFLGIDPRLDILRGTKHFDEMCRQVREPDVRQLSLAKRRNRNGAP